MILLDTERLIGQIIYVIIFILYEIFFKLVIYVLKTSIFNNYTQMSIPKVYVENGEMVGGLSIVPIIAEVALRHDNDAPTYFNGSSIVMEGS